MSEFWEFNKESIALGSIIAVISGVLFALTHEGTKWLFRHIRSRKKP